MKMAAKRDTCRAQMHAPYKFHKPEGRGGLHGEVWRAAFADNLPHFWASGNGGGGK